jgi:hypothetical protein
MTVITPARMYDSASPAAIPTTAQIVAGYIDGDYTWADADWDRFPEAVKVTITVTGNLAANVYDIEQGDGWPAAAAKWVRDRQAEGFHGATLYCSASNLGLVQEACRGLAYYLWLADWTDQPHALNGAVAVQYQNVGDSYDLSVVYDQVWLDLIDAANRPWRW